MKPKSVIIIIALFSLAGVSTLFSQVPVSSVREKAQHRSDSLFAAGMELYREGRYRDAAQLFSESDEIDKFELKLSENRFFYALHWMASCYYKMGDEENAAKLSDLYYMPPIDRRMTIESDSLAVLGDRYVQQEDFQNAIKYFRQCADLEKIILGTEHWFYASSLGNIAQCYMLVGDVDNAISLMREALRIVVNGGWKHRLFGMELTNSLIQFYLACGRVDDALPMAIELNQMIREEQGDTTLMFAASLSNLALCYTQNGDFNEAINVYSKILDIYNSLELEEDDIARLEAMDNLAQNYAYNRDFETAIIIEQSVEKILSEEIRGQLPHIKSIEKLVAWNSELNNSPISNRLCDQAFVFMEELSQLDSLDYAELCLIKAKIPCDREHFQQAVGYAQKARGIVSRVKGNKSIEYIETLSTLANLYFWVDPDKSKSYHQEKFIIVSDEVDKGHPLYLQSAIGLAQAEFVCGLVSSAKLRAEEVLSFSKNSKKLLEQQIQSLRILSYCSAFEEDRSKRLNLILDALELSKGLPNNYLYMDCLHDVAGVYQDLGDYYMYEKFMDEYLKRSNLSDIGTAKDRILFAEASYLIERQRYEEAEKLLIQVIQSIKGKLGNNVIYQMALARYASCLLSMGKRIKDSPYYKDIVSLSSGDSSADLFSPITSLTLDLALSADDFKSQQGTSADAEDKIIAAYHRLKQNPSFAHLSKQLLLPIVYFNRMNHHMEQLKLSSNDYSEYLRQEVKTHFAVLTTKERQMFWAKHKVWFESELHAIAMQEPSSFFVTQAYDALLLSKGLLLQTEVDFNNMILGSRDSVSYVLFDKMRRLRNQISFLERKQNEGIFFMEKIDSLDKEARSVERLLLDRSKVYGDFTHNLTIDWKQVQEKLGPQDLAVEFVSFPHSKDSTMYLAYTLKKGWTHPKMTVLFEEKQLKSISPDSLYVSKSVSELVWRPLSDDMQDVTTVYFSPGGELYNIAVESVPDWNDGVTVSDKRKYYRLSSTRELALIRDGRIRKTAAVYGGLDYNMSGRALARDGERALALPSASDPVLASVAPMGVAYSVADSVAASMRTRVAFPPKYLPATLEEAANVSRSLRGADIETTAYTDTLGTERSFKALSGERTGLLHIATHGFYWSEREVAASRSKFDFLQLFDIFGSGKYLMEDKALTRSGLLFSGANYVLANGGHLPEGVEDGILTAKELTALDLRGADLVVLSACQTGLGEITGDGVFGLQRGFKKAGANSLLMSLWKVNDNATKMLMTRFYDNLTRGLSKYDALQDAQRYLREYKVVQEVEQDEDKTPTQKFLHQHDVNQEEENNKIELVEKYPYAAPKFWAAFILLDGLN